MKWIIALLTIGLFRGIFFPDYRFGPNLIIIPLVTPIVIGYLASYWSMKYCVSRLAIVGYISLLLSQLVGTVVYGYSTGWQNVTNDLETLAVLQMTVIVQTVVYLVTYFLGSRYNKCRHWT
jgi:hypothetical protein